MSTQTRFDGQLGKVPAHSPQSSHWDIHAIVGELRDLRQASLAARNRLDKPAKLPSRTALAAVVENVIMALFPNRLASHVLDAENVDYFVGHTLDKALRELVGQALRELQFVAGDDVASDEQRDRAVSIVRQFAEQLPTIRELLETDITAAYEGDPAARSVDEILAGLSRHHGYRALSPGPHALWARRHVGRADDHRDRALAHRNRHSSRRDHQRQFLHRSRHRRGDWRDGHHRPARAPIPRGHARREAISGRGRRHHYQGERAAPDRGRRGRRLCQCHDSGRITIGRGSVIGGNVWLTRSVPPGSNIVQAQVRSETFGEGSGI